ncbi:acetyltransferase protein [Parvularcula bermudensis HTCC2503]|uniref:Acetyltransferase protein n=1 Tax=Parvularcula bermudensis (strain ATCC BAA-594 / HTCC2503 / KCTC 12087) TaxID=314260 RepID=E0TI78_PARBH|nr:acyltransferase [Parvularcula bermudensis]ADM09417.1 acetyltransferase protein [Parvularcula bermudensis HTCC2503]
MPFSALNEAQITMKKQIGLQWGRATAAIAVVVGHAIAHPGNSPLTEFARFLGGVGVTLFFVISGYIMVVTTGEHRFDGRAFVQKRILRIVPLYYCATAIVAVFVILAPQFFKSTTFDLKHILYSILFIPTLEPGSKEKIEPFVKLGWTLNYEMFFYLVFALLSWLNALNRAVVISLFFCILVLIGFLVDFDSAVPTFYTRPDLLGFLAGVWLGIFALVSQGQISQPLSRVSLGLFAGLGILLLFNHQGIWDNLGMRMVLIATCTLMVAFLAFGGNRYSRNVPNVLTVLGDASYSMYLFHMFAVGFVWAVAAKFLSPGWAMLVVLTATIGGIIAGVVVYYGLERNLTLYLNRFRPKSRTP